MQKKHKGATMNNSSFAQKFQSFFRGNPPRTQTTSTTINRTIFVRNVFTDEIENFDDVFSRAFGEANFKKV